MEIMALYFAFCIRWIWGQGGGDSGAWQIDVG